MEEGPDRFKAAEVLRGWAARDSWDDVEALRVGRLAFERIELEGRPAWAASLLGVAVRVSELVPDEVNRLFAIAKDPARWTEARSSFETLRRHALAAGSVAQQTVALCMIRMAETVAKVTFNASGEPAPYDHHAGWRLLKDLAATLDAAGRPAAGEMAARAALGDPKPVAQ